jgi:hypothetical protein
VRRENCQETGMSGGAAVRTPSEMDTGRPHTSSVGASSGGSAKTSAGETSGWWDGRKYSANSKEQHSPPPEESVPWWQAFSSAHERKAKPGRLSKRQCAVSGSQAAASRRSKVFRKPRTDGIGKLRLGFVQTKSTLAMLPDRMSRISIKPESGSVAPARRCGHA